VYYYETYTGNPMLPIDRYSINEPIITRHLKKDITFDLAESLPSVTISDFPNEKGYFMLWELSVSSDEQGRRFIPIFINDDAVLRPLAGKKIWEAMLDSGKGITVTKGNVLYDEQWAALTAAAQEFSYDAFLAMKEKTEQRHEESFRKYMYALELRTEAAMRIGIENIRRHRLVQLMKEKTAMNQEYEAGKKLCPEFRPVMVLHME